MPTTWTIAVDWSRNGSFTDTNDNITNRVIEAIWFVGQKQPYQEVADNSMLTLLLDNSDGRFSPENASSPLYGSLVPLRPLRVTADDSTTEHIMWQGWLESLRPAPGRYGKRIVQILAHGPMPFYMDVETKIKLQENKRTDEIIAELISEVVIPPALAEGWFLDLAGYSEIGVSTWLADTTAFSALDEGQVTLAIAADNWVQRGGSGRNTFDVYRAIADVVAAERGRFFFDREGKAVFWNRLRLQDEITSSLTLDNDMLDLTYSYAGIE